MSLDDFLLTVFCWVDDTLRRLALPPLRQRGPDPILADSEVLTIEIVGAFLGLAQDKALYTHFVRYHRRDFPRLPTVSRVTFVRQMANLWMVKSLLQEYLIRYLSASDEEWLADSVPLPICRFGRAKFCRRCRGVATYGYNHGDRHTFYGFRLHLRVSVGGLVRAAVLAPAHASDLAVLPALALPSPSRGFVDRNYHSPDVQRWLASAGVHLFAPFRTKKGETDPKTATAISKIRWYIETVIGQLAERFHLKRVWARDLWHIQSRLHRVLLSHTVAAWLCRVQGIPRLAFDQLLAAA